MAYDPEKERQRRLRANNAIGVTAAIIFLALLLIGGLIAFLVIPSVVTVPPPIPGREEPVGDERIN